MYIVYIAITEQGQHQKQDYRTIVTYTSQEWATNSIVDFGWPKSSWPQHRSINYITYICASVVSVSARTESSDINSAQFQIYFHRKMAYCVCLPHWNAIFCRYDRSHVLYRLTYWKAFFSSMLSIFLLCIFRRQRSNNGCSSVQAKGFIFEDYI